MQQLGPLLGRQATLSFDGVPDRVKLYQDGKE